MLAAISPKYGSGTVAKSGTSRSALATRSGSVALGMCWGTCWLVTAPLLDRQTRPRCPSWYSTPPLSGRIAGHQFRHRRARITSREEDGVRLLYDRHADAALLGQRQCRAGGRDALHHLP